MSMWKKRHMLSAPRSLDSLLLLGTSSSLDHCIQSVQLNHWCFLCPQKKFVFRKSRVNSEDCRKRLIESCLSAINSNVSKSQRELCGLALSTYSWKSPAGWVKERPYQEPPPIPQGAGPVPKRGCRPAEVSLTCHRRDQGNIGNGQFHLPRTGDSASFVT